MLASMRSWGERGHRTIIRPVVFEPHLLPLFLQEFKPDLIREALHCLSPQGRHTGPKTLEPTTCPLSLQEFKPDLIREALHCLNPRAVRVVWSSKSHEPNAKLSEPTYGTKYELSSVPAEWMSMWCGDVPPEKDGAAAEGVAHGFTHVGRCRWEQKEWGHGAAAATAGERRRSRGSGGLWVKHVNRCRWEQKVWGRGAAVAGDASAEGVAS